VLPEFGTAVPETDIAFPDDPEQRAYRASTTCNEFRAQIVFCAPDPATAHSLILQFNRWTTQGPMGRRFQAEYEFAGFKSKWPVVLESIDPGAVSTPVGDQKNLTIVVAEISLRATVPMFFSPGAGEPNDGKSAPAGYPVVVEANTFASVTGRRSKTCIDAKGNIVVEQS
jgi:hypothetical protein